MMHPVRRGLIHVVNWAYIWLPRFTGCHRRPDRSFRWRGGLPFPVCARCTGELVGMVLAAATAWLWQPPLWALALMAVPMVADGFLQLLTKYESTNLRRFATGLLFGYALVHAIIWNTQEIFAFGVRLGQQMRQTQ